MIDLRYVKKLIDIIDESTVDSIEISSDKGMKIRISKSPSGRGAMQVAPQPVMAPMIAQQALPAPRRRPPTVWRRWTRRRGARRRSPAPR
jgi:acetyl-CoA carboxylase biotin carboxyl carrier protein